MRVRFAMLIAGALSPSSVWALPACPEAELRRDPEAPVRFVDVDGLHRSFLAYGNCDPKRYVDLAESYADRIPKVLVARWSELEHLDASCRSDHRFRRFVLRFIDASGDFTALTQLAALSASCEGKAKLLCQDIHRQASEALREIDAIAPSTTHGDGGIR